MTFKNGEVQLLIPEAKAVEARIFMLQNTQKPEEEIPAEVEDAVIPVVRASGIPGRSKLAKPLKAVLKSGTKPDDVEPKTTTAINPVMFLNSEVRDPEPLHHDCLQTIEHVYSSRQDPRDEPLTNLELELFTDGSSFVRDGKQRAGYAVVATTKRPPPGTTKQGSSPGDYWQMDFSELPRQNAYRYLLVLADTFSGWPEASPCRTNKARQVTKLLLKEIIPRFGVPIGKSSDRGPHFVADIVQQLSKILGIEWDLHTPWRPQSSGKVERMNQTLKQQTSKTCQETSVRWPQALPLALLRIRRQPSSRSKISPYEVL
ncbi:uncharacterized protein, partial [Apteryx mantelli]|uniref:Integrase catalytic domain-containing protein n=1 Tax=Apteryx mantelli TaxID=2696672 RepID=A0ABM4G4G2_9AVES